MNMKQTKTLGQIAYEATEDGGKQNWGPWDKAPELVRSIHERMARAVEREVMRRVRRANTNFSTVENLKRQTKHERAMWKEVRRINKALNRENKKLAKIAAGNGRVLPNEKVSH